MVARHFIELGYPARRVLAILELPVSSYYYKPRLGKRGNTPSTHTFNIHSGLVSNDQICSDINELLSQEFVDYGYKKVRWYLVREKGYVIGYKKVYRIMKQARLVLSPPVARTLNRQWIKDIVPQPTQCFEHLEMDIKYVWVSGVKRHIYKLTIVDVFSRLNMAELVQESIKKQDVAALLDYVNDHYQLPKTIYIRTDNGSQFISELVGQWMVANDVIQEFTRPATPEQNGHIEAYHSIFERAICRRIELNDIQHAKEVIERFHYFYNYIRIHSGIG